MSTGHYRMDDMLRFFDTDGDGKITVDGIINI